MYNSLILLHINYGILVWGHQAHRIFKLQKRAIRIITLSKYNADPIYIELKFLKLDDIYKLQQLKLKRRNNLFIPRTTHEFATKYIRNNIQIEFFLLTAYMVFPLYFILLGIINHALLFLIVIFVNL